MYKEGNPMRSTSRKPMAALCDDLSFTVLPHDILSKKKAKLTKVSVEFSMAPLKIIERWFSKDSGASMT